MPHQLVTVNIGGFIFGSFGHDELAFHMRLKSSVDTDAELLVCPAYQLACLETLGHIMSSLAQHVPELS